MKQLNICDETWERLQKHGVVFIDKPEDVIIRALDALEEKTESNIGNWPKERNPFKPPMWKNQYEPETKEKKEQDDFNFQIEDESSLGNKRKINRKKYQRVDLTEKIWTQEEGKPAKLMELSELLKDIDLKKSQILSFSSKDMNMNNPSWNHLLSELVEHMYLKGIEKSTLEKCVVMKKHNQYIRANEPDSECEKISRKYKKLFHSQIVMSSFDAPSTFLKILKMATLTKTQMAISVKTKNDQKIISMMF